MKHVKGYFPLPKRGELFSPKNVITFTGNSYIRKDGHLVMGAGAAKSVRDWCPEVGLLLGKKIPHLQEYNLASAKVNYSGRQIPIGVFQVKYHFQDSADLDLIKRSAQKLKAKATESSWTFHLNFPGIGNGKLKYETVLPIVESLPDNVWVYTL